MKICVCLKKGELGVCAEIPSLLIWLQFEEEANIAYWFQLALSYRGNTSAVASPRWYGSRSVWATVRRISFGRQQDEGGAEPLKEFGVAESIQEPRDGSTDSFYARSTIDPLRWIYDRSIMIDLR